MTLLRLLSLVVLVPGLLGAQTATSLDLHTLPASKPTLIAHYGEAPQQIAELRLPRGRGPFPVVAVLHGGCFLASMENLHGTAALATALTDMGYATWNVEYRAIGDAGGGWPGTYQDFASALDYLRTLARTQPILPDAVVALGHSAGAAGAAWLAERPKLPAASEVRGADPLPVLAAVVIDGPIDLQPYIGLDKQICGQTVFAPLMGGTPQQEPQRYAQVTPSALLPLHVPMLLVSSQVLPLSFAQSYATQATAAGDTVTVLSVQHGGHFDVIAPGSPAWNTQVKPALSRFLQRTFHLAEDR